MAAAIEAISQLIPGKWQVPANKAFRNGDIQYARTCYDHLAGRVAVNLTQGLVQQKIIQLGEDEYQVTPKGKAWFENIGVDIEAVKQQKRFLCPALVLTGPKEDITRPAPWARRCSIRCWP